jgi:ATP-dependent RNA helicase DDX27
VLKRCSRQRQTLLFSATVNTEVQDLAAIALQKPMRVSATKVNKVARNLVQEFVQVTPVEGSSKLEKSRKRDEKKGRKERSRKSKKGGQGSEDEEEDGGEDDDGEDDDGREDYWERKERQEKKKKEEEELEKIEAANVKQREATLVALCKNTYKKRTIIFFSTKKQAHRCAIMFGLLGLKFSELHGNLSQTDRCEGIESFQNGEADFLLATDLAARGLDIHGVEAVINFECPKEDAKYIHRVGRTARMGASGCSVTLYCGDEEYKRVKRLAKQVSAGLQKENSSNTEKSSDSQSGKDGKDKGKKKNGKDTKKDANKSSGKDSSSNTPTSTSTVKKRQVAPEQIAKCIEKIRALEWDIEDIQTEEKTERELRLADSQVKKAENMEQYKHEIRGKPRKIWVMNNKEKENFRLSVKDEQEQKAEERRIERESKMTRKMKGKMKREKMEKAKDQGKMKAAKRKFRRTGEDPMEKNKLKNKAKKAKKKGRK